MMTQRRQVGGLKSSLDREKLLGVRKEGAQKFREEEALTLRQTKFGGCAAERSVLQSSTRNLWKLKTDRSV